MHEILLLVVIVEQQRAELHSFRTKDMFDDDVIRLIENRLDPEEEGLQRDAE